MAISINPTDEQAQIMVDVADPGGGSLMVEAYAGTAKTTTIQLAAPGVRVPALALAFNKSIANELTPRLPGLFTVKTFNGLGYGAWMRANPGVKMQLDEKKLGKIVSEVVKGRQLNGFSGDQWDQLRQMVSKAMQAGITPGNIGDPLNPDSTETWIEIADDCWVIAEDREMMIDLSREILSLSIQLGKQGFVSFDDMVYLPTVLGGRYARYPFVVTDEAQDLNPLNHRQLQLSLNERGRLVAVGDSRQAIYAFRGADSESMGNLRRIHDRWTDRRLTLTFRCPKAVVERQQEHAPGYRAADGNVVGRFMPFRAPDVEKAHEWEGWSMADLEELKQAPTDQIAVLCRNNAPILSLAFKLIRQRVGVKVLGRDIGKGLITLLSKIAPDSTPADVLMGKIREWAEREISLALANDKEEKVSTITDRSESLVACLEGSEARDCGELKVVIRQLFEKDVGQITLASGHRSKGLEWNIVVHLDPWRIPSKYAKLAAQQGDMRQMKQEANLRYVIETRTKHTLVNANLGDFNE